MRVVEYSVENGFKDGYMVRLLEENGITVPDEVKKGGMSTIAEITDADASPQVEVFSVEEGQDGKLSISRLGEINPKEETKKINVNMGKESGQKVIIGIIDAIINWIVKPVELPSIVTDEEDKNQS